MSTIIRGSFASHGGVAAVDEQVAARHEGRGVARQVDGRAGDLDGQAQPAEQVLGAHHLARLVHVLPAAQHPPGLDRARRDRVGANALDRVIGSEHLRELDQGTLGRAVRRASRRGDATELRGDEDYAAAAARDHRGDRGLRHQEGAGEVDPDHAVPGRFVHLEHRGRIVAVGRAVHQDVEAAEALHRGGYGAAAAGAVGDVEMHRERLAAAGLDLGGGRLRARLLDVGARDLGAGRRDGERGRAPDPVRGADHDGDLLLEREPRIDHHVLHAVPSTPAGARAGATVYDSRTYPAGRSNAMLPTHGRYDYSNITKRPDYAWPGGRRLAVYVALNIEAFSFGAGKGAAIAPPDQAQSHSVYSWRDYGNRVGIWRLFELLDELGIPAEAQMNTAVYEMAPDIPGRLRARGDEVLGHGVTNSDEQGHLDESRERALIDEVTNTIAKHEGAKPIGWMSPWLSNSAVTLDLLQE